LEAASRGVEATPLRSGKRHWAEQFKPRWLEHSEVEAQDQRELGHAAVAEREGSHFANAECLRLGLW
jgi:hypothetical protein